MIKDLLLILLLSLEIVGGGTFAGLYEHTGKWYWLLSLILWLLLCLISVVFITIYLVRREHEEKE